VGDRSYTYVFRGNFSNLGAGLAVMGKGVGDLGTKLTTLDKKGATARQGLTTLGSAAGRTGLVVAAGLVVAERSVMNFDKAMSNVAATGAATTIQLRELRDAALEAGQTTAFSATEAAGGIEALLKAGVSASDVIGGGLKGSLDLAAAGQLEVADAAEIAATAMTQFKLSGQDVSHVADLLSAGAGKAQGDVSDLSMALKQSGLVAAQMGVSLEETVGTLADFASAGLLGSDAGTSFRTMLLRLANPTQESAQLMQQLGIQAYNAQGQFVGIAALSDQLAGAFQGQTQAQRDAALATIFGSDAIRAASVLYSQGGDGVRDWTDKVDDAGYAADVAATRLDNLSGDLHKFGSALQTAFIGAGEGSQGPLRGVVQGATEAVNALSVIPGPAQTAATGLLAVTAVLGSSVWAGSKVVSGISSMKLALQQLGIEAVTTRQKMALMATGGTAAALGLADFVHVLDLMDSRARSNATGDAVVKNAQDISDALDFSNLGKHADELHINLGRLSEDLAQNGEQGEYVQRVIEQLKDSSHGFGALLDAEAHNLSLGIIKGDAEQSSDALKDLQTIIEAMGPSLNDSGHDFTLAGIAAGLTATATGQYTDAMGAAADANNAAKKAIHDAMDAMRDQRDEALSAFDAVTQYRQAMKDAAAQAKKSNAGIKGNSDAALENRQRLSELASAWNGLDNQTKNAAGAFKAARQNFIDTAAAMGVPRKAARDLADTLLDLPKSKVIPVTTPGADASVDKLHNVKAALDALRDKTINIYTVRHMQGLAHAADAADARNPRTGVGGVPTSLPITQRGSATDGLVAQNGAKAAYALGLVAKGGDDAAHGAKALKERLHDVEKRLERVSKAADAAHDALQGLRDQKAGLASSVTGSLEHDAFSGDLSMFETQTAADTNDATAVLSALRQLVTNGLDPHSALFKRLAASGNVMLIQQFAALTRAQLGAEAAAYAAGQGALGQVGQFAGSAAFDDLIRKQDKTTNHLDHTVHHLAHQVNQLEKAIKDLPRHVRDGAKDGTQDVGEKVRRGAEDGTRAGNDERTRSLASFVRTGRG
jgi:TP901 family phage tail tape measure protein